MSAHKKVRAELERLSDPVYAKRLQGFFKSGKGEYGEEDIFLGLLIQEILVEPPRPNEAVELDARFLGHRDA